MGKYSFCPKCGRVPKKIKTIVKNYKGEIIPKYVIFCTNCSKTMCTSYTTSEEEATKEWNNLCKGDFINDKNHI